MPQQWLLEFSGKGFSVFLGLLLGGVLTLLASWWRRRRQRQSVIQGDARDTVVIHHHILDRSASVDGRPKTSLRIRTMGQAELDRVVPNGHLGAVLLHRAFAVTAKDSLISMEGPEGSFLLETLTNFVCDKSANRAFEHDRYLMAPCCEPAELAEHQPITILVIAVKDLEIFDQWATCRDIQVEHGSDGCRVLTLMKLAQRFKKEQEEITRRRIVGERTKHVETMYVLDLALDKQSYPIPTRPVPWVRYESTLKAMSLA
jgi:hypothetical protein